jgi:hypothetical protein
MVSQLYDIKSQLYDIMIYLSCYIIILVGTEYDITVVDKYQNLM